jgi:hypothetical protein
MMSTEGFFMRLTRSPSPFFPRNLLMAYPESSGECPIVKISARPEGASRARFTFFEASSLE